MLGIAVYCMDVRVRGTVYNGMKSFSPFFREFPRTCTSSDAFEINSVSLGFVLFSCSKPGVSVSGG